MTSASSVPTAGPSGAVVQGPRRRWVRRAGAFGRVALAAALPALLLAAVFVATPFTATSQIVDQPGPSPSAAAPVVHDVTEPTTGPWRGSGR